MAGHLALLVHPVAARSYEIDEVPMHAQVAGQLGMKRGSEQRPLANGDDPSAAPRQRLLPGDGRDHVNTASDRLDPRSPDEYGTQRSVVLRQPVDRKIRLEGVDLTAERVAADGHVDPADRLLALDGVDDRIGEHDHARA